MKQRDIERNIKAILAEVDLDDELIDFDEDPEAVVMDLIANEEDPKDDIAEVVVEMYGCDWPTKEEIELDVDVTTIDSDGYDIDVGEGLITSDEIYAILEEKNGGEFETKYVEVTEEHTISGHIDDIVLTKKSNQE